MSFSRFLSVFTCTVVGLSVSVMLCRSAKLPSSLYVADRTLTAYIQRRGGLAQAGGTLSVIRTTNGQIPHKRLLEVTPPLAPNRLLAEVHFIFYVKLRIYFADIDFFCLFFLLTLLPTLFSISFNLSL